MSYGGGGSGSSSIHASTDVALNNPADGQYLAYSASLAKWQNITPPHEAVTTVTSAGTSQALTVPSSGKATYYLKASASSCAITMTGAVAGTPAYLTVWLKQSSAGNNNWTFPAATLYPTGTAPTLSSAANDVDVITLTSADGGTSWLLVPAATQAN